MLIALAVYVVRCMGVQHARKAGSCFFLAFEVNCEDGSVTDGDFEAFTT